MQCNVGKADRAIRISAGLIIMALGVFFHSWWGLIGIVPVITGTTRWCPLYLPIGLNTNGKGD